MVEYGSVLDGYIVPGEPLVSVKVTAYNHGKYIRQCLDGILMQKVNFPYEVLVHDDASPDDTADIIREYEARFPTVIKPIYQTENQYSKHDGTIGRIQNGRAKGKYMAQCEGDDYWTDPGKLQMQVDFLEEHEEYVGTAHNCRVVDENSVTTRDILPYPRFDKHKFTFDDVECSRLPGQTATLVYRNIFVKLESKTLEAYYAINFVGDRKLALLLTEIGDIYCFDEIMSSYRFVTTSGTSWSAQNAGKYLAIETLRGLISLWLFSKNYFSREYKVYSYIAYSFQVTALRIIKYHNRKNVLDLFRFIQVMKQNCFFSPI